jgi:ATP-dependent helicase/nuclease subunit B
VEPFEVSSPPKYAQQTAALACLERGGAVVTGNARAARVLRHVHAAEQRAAGRRAWPTPQIHDWESWMSILWKQHLQNAPDAPLLLSALQERSVWKKIASAAGGDSEAIAKLASKAWELLGDFNAHGELQHFWAGSATRDVEVFRGWAAAFDRECRKSNWMTRSDLPALLGKSIQDGTIGPPDEILMIGFDRFSLAQQTLIDAAQKVGSTVTHLEPLISLSAPHLVQAKDLRDELESCAWWARQTLEANPTASIAIVVQGIDERRGEIERTFRGILMPESAGIEADESMPFEFSLGAPLATVPVVKAALLLLRWLTGPLEQAAISWLTISGFLDAGGEDLAAMAALDAEIRKKDQMPSEVPLEVFTQYRPRLDSETVRRFFYRLRDLQRTAQAEGVGSRRKTFPEWIDFSEARLREARWPGARVLESVEFQALKSWEGLTSEVAGLSFDGTRVSWREFVTVIDRYSAETIFAPESRGAPIQIMGALESAGQHFDALWLLGADDRQWPLGGQPNPLLPLWLQRKAAMPYSSIDLDWELNLAIVRRLAASSSQCILSHALRDDLGELRPSALLAEAIGQPLTTVSSEQLHAKLHAPGKPPQRRQTIGVEDELSVPWPRDIRAGGADILKRQSACAFQSFAVRRLGAEELGAAERGLTPRDRGTLAHSVLQALWSKENTGELLLQSRDDLINAKVGGRLPEILSHHITKVFERELRGAYRDGDWAQAYLQVEQNRLQAVLLEWLGHEMEREPFTVEEHEKGFPAQIKGLPLNLRVDRIDLVDGGRLILDYKTGKVMASMWDGERPDEPQLPLYGIHGPVDDLRGVLFAQVRVGDMDFKGRVEDARKTLLGKLPANSALVRNPLTQEALDEWEVTLGALAEQFLAGGAAVAPKEYPKTCRYCPLPALCRIAETPILEAEDDEEFEDVEENVGDD